ncbi:hypothetical protein QBZ16_000617 [Prototheca wickerhamii]|uniref:Mitochondrial carrier protein n=1 Tax=Prototheca wickerhamii TaxID=3111 RepID=A0AAD9MN58_PROWI|nr:hypothetical protein QBZ16_000617 [Prototheca wickerhamii]
MPPGNLRRTLQSIYRDEGISGLFRGNGAAVLRIVPYSAIHFTMYEHYRRVLLQRWIHNSSAERHRPVNPLWDLLAGSAAGATAVLITYPLDLVRTRLAYHSEAHGPAPAPRTLHRTLEREGVRGIYHGVGASMYGILPYAGLKFYVYQSLKQWCHRTYDWSAVRRERVPGANQGGDAGDTSSDHATTTQPVSAARLPVPLMLLFGGVAGLVAQTATYPFDVVRRRMQVEALQLESLHLPRGTALALKTTPQAMLLIARQQGWRALFAGLSINYLKVVPSTAIGFTVYDSLKHLLDLPSNL